MARRGVPKQVNWYLREWMDTLLPIARGRQAKMSELTGWSKATTSQLYNNAQDYSPKIVNEAARALNIDPHELLMHPEKAMALRKVLAGSQEIATLVASEPTPEPTDIFDHMEKRDAAKSKPHDGRRKSA